MKIHQWHPIMFRKSRQTLHDGMHDSVNSSLVCLQHQLLSLINMDLEPLTTTHILPPRVFQCYSSTYETLGQPSQLPLDLA